MELINIDQGLNDLYEKEVACKTVVYNACYNPKQSLNVELVVDLRQFIFYPSLFF